MEVIEVTEREIEVIEVIERGPQGVAGPQPDINYMVVSSARTLEAADLIAADTSGGAFTLTLPANPSNGDAVDIFDFSETFDTNNLTIARNGSKIESLTEDLVCNVEGAYFTLIYTGATRGWQVLPRYGTSGGGGESVLTTQGDTLYRAVGVNARLPIGTTGQVLKVSAQGLPSWQNESGAVSSVAGRTGAVTLASADITDATSSATADTIVKRGGDGAVALETLFLANLSNSKTSELNAGNITDDRVLYAPDASGTISLEGHGTRHNATGSDPIYNEMVAITGSGNANVNGYYYLANDGGDVDYIKIGSRRRAMLVFTNSRWNIQYDGVTQYQSEVRNNSNKPWNSTTWTNLIGSEINPAPTVSEANVDSVLDAISRSVDFVSGLGTASTANVPTTGNASSTQVVLGSDTRLSDARTPSAHAASHASSGSDPLFDQDLNTTDDVIVNSVTATGLADIVGEDLAIVDGNGEFKRFAASGLDTSVVRANLGLGSAATADSGDFAATSHTHELTALAATGATNGHVLTANGSNGATFAALPASGVTGAASSASDVLGVSGSNITGVDANADRIVYWNNTSNKLAYGTPADAGAAAASHTHAASDITSGTIDTARLASGTANSGTFLRGDQTWAAAGGVTTGSVDNAVLRADGVGGSTSQSSDLNIEDATTSTENNVQISNQHSGQTNSSLVLTPKGTGAFILGPRPTGAASTGNARGTNAVDLQTVRGAATRVASGQESVICGGSENTASGLRSAVLGGTSNTASGERSVVLGGASNSAAGLQCIVFGQSNSVSGSYNSIFGGFVNTCATGSYMSFIAGQANTTSAKITVALGEYALADRNGTFAWGGGRFAANGDAQFVRAILRRKVSTAAATELLTDVDGTTGRFSIASGKTVAALVHIVAATSGGEFACQYIRECVIRNRGGTTALRGSVQTVGTDTEDFAACDVTISADDTNDALKIDFTGTAPVTGYTGTASTDRINKVAHGFSNNDDIIFSSLTGGAGLTLNTVTYWVINANADDFQVSATRGGAAVNITTDYSDMTATRLFRVVALVDAVEVGHGT